MEADTLWYKKSLIRRGSTSIGAFGLSLFSYWGHVFLINMNKASEDVEN